MLWYRYIANSTTSEQNQFLTPWYTFRFNNNSVNRDRELAVYEEYEESIRMFSKMTYQTVQFSQSNDAKYEALLPSHLIPSLTRRMAGGGQTVDAEGRKGQKKS